MLDILELGANVLSRRSWLHARIQFDRREDGQWATRHVRSSWISHPAAHRSRQSRQPQRTRAGWSVPDDSVPDELVGYRGPSACQIAGITYRQLDYWARTSLVVPSIRGAAGSGSQRLYSFKDILVLKIVKRLLDTGISLHNIRVAVDHLRQRGVKDLANITLFSDGTTVYECTSAEEVVDLLQGGQGVFGIAVSGAMRELTGAIADFPGERADGGESIPAPEDELASRRKHRDRKIG